MSNDQGPTSGDSASADSNWKSTFELWQRLGANEKRFTQILAERGFWQVPVTKRLALFSWAAFGLNLVFCPFAYYFLKQMHYKGATVLACWLLVLSTTHLADVGQLSILVGVLMGAVLGHLATYDVYRREKCGERLWPWAPAFLGSPRGALTGVVCSFALLCVVLVADASSGTAFQNGAEAIRGLFMLMLALLFLGVVLALYFLPSIIGFKGRHPNRWAIFVINLCFGSTGIGWLGALIWSLHKVHDPGDGRSAGGESGLNLFVNDTKIVALQTPLDAASRSTGNPSIADLEKLAALFERGLLSEEEFESQKSRILQELRPQ